MSKNSVDMSMLSFMPIRQTWLAGLPAYHAEDGRIVRACISLLFSAMGSRTAGMIIYNDDILSGLAHLSKDEWLKHKDLLLKGWRKSKVAGVEFVSFAPLVEMAQRMHANYRAELQRLQDGVVIAMAAPDIFNTEMIPDNSETLASSTGEKVKTEADDLLKKTSVKKLLPDDVKITEDLKKFLVNSGYAEPDHEEIWQLFVDECRSKAIRAADWRAQFRTWIKDKSFYGRLRPDLSLAKKAPIQLQRVKDEQQQPERVRFSVGRAGNKGAAAENSTRESLNRVASLIRSMPGEKGSSSNVTAEAASKVDTNLYQQKSIFPSSNGEKRVAGSTTGGASAVGRPIPGSKPISLTKRVTSFTDVTPRDKA